MRGSLFLPLFETLLLLPRIPTQLPAYAVDPMLALPTFCLHRRERVPARTDGNIIARPKLDSLATVKAGPRRCSSFIGNTNTQHNGVRENDGSKGQGVCANRGDEHDWVFGMAEGTASSQVVCCGTCRRRYADSVCKDGCKMFIISEYLNVRKRLNS